MEICIKPFCFNPVTSKNVIFCDVHAINNSNKCQAKWCRTKLKNPNETLCKEHQIDSIIGRSGRFCLLCNKKSSQNYPGFTRRIYCKKHAIKGMRDVSHGSCAFDGCDKRPNPKNKKYCMTHYKMFNF